MKRIVGILALVFLMCLMMASFCGCNNNLSDYSIKTSNYIVKGDSTEELVSYQIMSFDKDNTPVTEIYAPNGTRLSILKNGKFERTEAWTTEIEKEMNEKLGAMSLLGTNSDDLIYESKKDASGFTTEEYIASKSGVYPAIRVVYEKIY